MWKLFNMFPVMCHIQKHAGWGFVQSFMREDSWQLCERDGFNIWFTGQWFLQQCGGTENSCLLWRACGRCYWSLLCRTWRTSTGTWFLIFPIHLQRYVTVECTSSHGSCSEYDETHDKTHIHTQRFLLFKVQMFKNVWDRPLLLISLILGSPLPVVF